jgi:hypothetical protein
MIFTNIFHLPQHALSPHNQAAPDIHPLRESISTEVPAHRIQMFGY